MYTMLFHIDELKIMNIEIVVSKIGYLKEKPIEIINQLYVHILFHLYKNKYLIHLNA